MHPQPRARWLLAALLLLSLATQTGPAQAQGGASVRLSPPVVDNFPEITLYATVTDDEGRYIPSLPATTFQISEDGTPIPVAVEEVETGARQVFVLQTTEGMGVRDSLGRTRFERLRESLLAWWRLPEAAQVGVDDWSLVTAEGPLASHEDAAADLAARLDRHQPAFDLPDAGLASLATGLDLAADPLPRPGMATTVVFFTPFLDSLEPVEVENAVGRARELGAPIHVVYLGPEDLLEEPQSDLLRRLAVETGGTFRVFNPDQGLGDLARAVQSLRVRYRLRYLSQVRQTGQHEVRLRVRAGTLDLISPPVTFHVEVEPPQVIFIRPPTEVLRRSEDPSVEVQDLPPTSLDLQVLVDFPDGHARPLRASRLLVDGQAVDENTEPPFDRFTWDLTAYVESGDHRLEAVVVDSLGLEGRSVPVRVRVEVEAPPSGLLALRGSLGPLALVLSLLAVTVLTLAGLAAYRRRGTTAAQPPEPAVPLRTRLRRAGIGRQRRGEQPEAFLIPLAADGSEGEPIPLTGGDLTLGRDASLAPVPLEDPSVAGLHARLIRQADGGYRIEDQGSVAGTWVNYEPVPEGGRRLHHGDLIHLGRVVLRFHQPGVSLPEPVVRPAEPAPEEAGG